MVCGGQFCRLSLIARVVDHLHMIEAQLIHVRADATDNVITEAEEYARSVEWMSEAWPTQKVETPVRYHRVETSDAALRQRRGYLIPQHVRDASDSTICYKCHIPCQHWVWKTAKKIPLSDIVQSHFLEPFNLKMMGSSSTHTADVQFTYCPAGFSSRPAIAQGIVDQAKFEKMTVDITVGGYSMSRVLDEAPFCRIPDPPGYGDGPVHPWYRWPQHGVRIVEKSQLRDLQKQFRNVFRGLPNVPKIFKAAEIM